MNEYEKEKLREYIKEGGRLVKIHSIDCHRSNPKHIILRTSSNGLDKLFFHREEHTFHTNNPLTNENKITNEGYIVYLKDSIDIFGRRLESKYKHEKKLINFIKDSNE